MIAGITAGGMAIPPEIGELYEGGYYAGRMNYGIAGEHYYLVIAPLSSRAARAFKTAATSDAGTFSLINGKTNMDLLVGASYPAAEYCRGLTTGGFNDWYLPAREELELAYRNFKPTTANNSTGNRSADAGGGPTGTNIYSEPPGAAYTTTDPAQTSNPLFQSGGSQDLTIAARFTSCQASLSTGAAMIMVFDTGAQTAISKTSVLQVLPFRRIKAP